MRLVRSATSAMRKPQNCKRAPIVKHEDQPALVAPQNSPAHPLTHSCRTGAGSSRPTRGSSQMSPHTHTPLRCGGMRAKARTAAVCLRVAQISTGSERAASDSKAPHKKTGSGRAASGSQLGSAAQTNDSERLPRNWLHRSPCSPLRAPTAPSLQPR